MFQKQKEVILKLLKSNEADKKYGNNYLFSYQDFFDSADDFTAFACENRDGKQKYTALMKNLMNTDEAARIFVQVYGFEEDDNAQFIYADTLIVFSKLSLVEIRQIFHKTEDIFPSDIGELTDFTQAYFIMDKEGELYCAANILDNDQSVYYCWWD